VGAARFVYSVRSAVNFCEIESRSQRSYFTEFTYLPICKAFMSSDGWDRTSDTRLMKPLL
jgi:hypothetical protein